MTDQIRPPRSAVGIIMCAAGGLVVLCLTAAWWPQLALADDTLFLGGVAAAVAGLLAGCMALESVARRWLDAWQRRRARKAQAQRRLLNGKEGRPR